jgi:poly-gamma-glutamate capsule biosynthesis protein CapA/YwtB (metallophosphatase superfamily)
VRDALSSADLALGNLECALTIRGQPEPKTYTFAAPPAGAQSLAWAGFDLVTLGNNHILDYGVEGLEDTLRSLDEAGVGHVGAGMNAAAAAAPLIFERNGLRIAFLAFVDVPIGNYDYHAWEATADRPGIIWGRPAALRSAVRSARQQADIVVVLLHFGYEGVDYESPEQETLAYAAIDAGASLVIGSHAHVLQPVKEYNGGLIVYSLGNFVFDDFEPAFNQSIILRVRLGRQGVLDWESLPVEIVDGVPQVQ